MVLTRLVLAAIVCATLTTAASDAATATIPSAFARAPVASDQLPATFKGIPGESAPSDSRRIATLQGTKRSWSVYIFKQMRTNELGTSKLMPKKPRLHICLFIFTREPGGIGGAGGGCSPPASFFSPRHPHVSASATGRVFAGVASDRVARVVVVGSRGVRHEVRLTPDNGFIFNCRAYNGCACVVSRLQAFDKSGNRIANQDWRSSAPNCRRR